MPVTWKISHEKRLMVVRAEGKVVLGDIEDCLDAIVVGEAFAYAKLFDARGVAFTAFEGDVMQVGARLRAYATADFKGGPVAFVTDGVEATDYIRRYLNLAGGERPARIFAALAPARKWLDEQRGQPAAQNESRPR